MNPETASPAPRTAVTPRLEVSLEDSGPFLRAAGLVLDEISAVRVTGHLDLGPGAPHPVGGRAWRRLHGRGRDCGQRRR